jgi:hypothetical protein
MVAEIVSGRPTQSQTVSVRAALAGRQLIVNTQARPDNPLELWIFLNLADYESVAVSMSFGEMWEHPQERLNASVAS